MSRLSKHVALLAAFVIGIFLDGLPAAPSYNAYPSGTRQRQNAYTSPVQACNPFEDLQHEVNNHEAELRVLDERIATQESVLEAIRQQFVDDSIANQDWMKSASSALEDRLSAMEDSLSGVAADIKQMQGHANETSKALVQYKQKIADMDKQIVRLETAMQAVLAAYQADMPQGNAMYYEVRSGDTLEKVARKNNVSIGKIKELNGLKNDRIFIGQKLKVQ